MKKKIFNSLLMGALLFASIGSFTACKDYDDDINANKSDITALQSQLKTLEEKLSTAQTDLTNAQAAADAAKKAAEAAQGTADAAQADATEALKLAKLAATQTEVDALKATITEVQTLLASKVDQDVYDAKIKEIAGQIEAIDVNLNVLGIGLEDEETARIAADADLQLQIDALEAFKTSIQEMLPTFTTLVQNINDLTEKLSTVKNDISTNKADISDLKTSMSNAETSISTALSSIEGLQSSIDNLNVFINKLLTSLVFRPDFYYGGIEAMEATTLKYKAITLNDDSPANAPKADGETWVSASEESSVSPLVTAYYHMNPQYFDIANIKSLSFNVLDRQYVQLGSTRSADKLNPTGEIDKESSKDGLLAVKISLDASQIADSDDKVTVLALRAHINGGDGTIQDSIVTSDYAALCKSEITDVVIADNKANTNPWEPCVANENFHVFTTAEKAINNPYTHNLVYNDETGINLSEIVEAHFKRNDAAETKCDDVKKYGLKWEFASSHYYAGTNKTSESVHVRLAEKDGETYAIACMPDDEGTGTTEVQNQASIDREPMVRVVLRDTVNNKVVAVGFIKMKIVSKSQEETNPEPIEITFDNTDGYDLDCDGYHKTLTWVEIENKVLATLNNGEGMSKENFEAEYVLQEVDDLCCQLYAKDSYGKWITSTETQTVTNVPNDENYHTSVLKWDVEAADIYNKVWDGKAYKADQEVTATVLFKSNNPAVNPDIYVTFKSGKISTPSATWGDNNKISNYWAAENGALGSGTVEIHNNVEVVGQTNANCEYDNDILNTLVGNKVTLGTISGSDSFTEDNLTFSFCFIIDKYAELKGQSGKTYTMSVGDDGNTLYAAVKGTIATQAVAKLSASAGDLESLDDINSIISYQKTDYALDILNAVGHKDLANTASATIGINAVNGCDMVLPITDGQFDVKFLRPVDGVGADDVTFTDAKDNGNVAYLYDLVDFNDWRDQWSLSPNYYEYYGIYSIIPNTDAITTNLNGGTLGTTKLSDITEGIKFNYDFSEIVEGATPDKDSYGILKYENNGQVTSTFIIRVPLTVKYTWGEITTITVDITIEKTVANPSHRR